MAGKLFAGKDTRKEELREAHAVKSGRITPGQYVKGEKSEGSKGSTATAKALKSGKLSPAAYAKRKK